MKIIRNLNNIADSLKNSSLIIGNFDGLHLGHQEILKFNQKIAKTNKQKTALLTFEPHPRNFFHSNLQKDVRIYSLAQKLQIIRQEKLVDLVFLIKFNKKLANLEAEDFVKEILINKLQIKNLIVGYDFTFGKNRLGNADLLQNLAKNYDYNFYQISAQKNQDQTTYSSTLIRNLIKNGDVKNCHKILGRNYRIKGTVIKGEQNGRKIGFKTANILPRHQIIKPKFGVYKSITIISDKKYNSITNFGIKPTFSGKKELFETHIFNFEEDIYGKKVEIEFLNFIRPEIKFANIIELKDQINRDIKLAQSDKV